MSEPMTQTHTKKTDRADADALVEQICVRAAQIRGDVANVVTNEVDRLAPLVDEGVRARVISRAIARLSGLDLIEEFLVDPDVDEVMVNAGTEVWIDRAGRLDHVADLDAGVIDVVLERILAPLGKRLDRSSPIVDARLHDGARLCAVVAPIAVDGTSVSIRRHRTHRFELETFADTATVALLHDIVDSRANTLVTGATSAGKTSLLAALAARVGHHERLVVVEDTTELPLTGHNAIRLQSRTAGVDGTDPVDLSQLVRTALRLRPDRLIIGEFRGDEVLAVVQALNTGHDGSMATCHANNALDGLRRAETLTIQAAPTWPLEAVRRHLSRSVDVVVHLDRSGDQRRVTEIVEVVESGDEPSGRILATNSRVVADLRRRRT